MTSKSLTNRISFRELLILILLFFSGIAFIMYIWDDTKKQEAEKVLQNARSIAASLPKDALNNLPENPEDLKFKDFNQLKKTLHEVIVVNKNAKFAYFYLQRNDKLFFIVDSEPESSADYSPPGQEFTEADPSDKKPFQNGKALVTKPVTDRWGTWVSAEVPVKDTRTGEVIAVFGMDYNANSWKNRLLFEVSESVILVLIVLFLIFISQKGLRKNILLNKEITQRKKAEKALLEREMYYRLLFELNPQPMFVYDLESMMILEVNRAAIKIYGYSVDEFLSMSIIGLKVQQDFTRLWKNSMEDPNPFHHTEVWNHCTKSGQIIQVEVHSHNLDFRHKNARLVLLIDITDKIRTEDILRENKLTLSNLIGNLPGMVYRCAPDENYTMDYISEGCTRITGYSPDEFVTQKTIAFNDIILPEYREFIWLKWLEIINTKNVFEEEYPIKTSSGEIKWVWERGRGVYNEKEELQYLEGYIEDITNWKLSEEKLLKTETNFKRSIEESPFGVRIISNDGQTIYANATLLRIFSFESLDDFNQIPATKWYTPKSYSEHLIREEKRKNKLPVESEYEIKIIRTNQEIRYLQVFRSEILWNREQKIQIIYLDITERKLAEKELRKLSQAIEQNPVSVFITNSDGIIEYINPRFTEITGFEASEAIGKSPVILKSGKMGNEFYSNMWKTITTGNIWNGEIINKNKAGKLYWTNKSISPIHDNQGQITNFVAIDEEITEKKFIEAELIKAKEKAEESDRLKSAFLANISHEIRTPMNGILGFAELLKSPDLSPENQQEFIEVIEKSGQRMLNIIHDLIDISKIEAGETTLRIRNTNINKMLKEIHLFFMPEVNQKNIHLDYHCDLTEEESMIETDSVKINQTLVNLIKNAVKFTKEGSITFGYISKESTFDFYVSDTGPGIPPEQKDLIFERFMQGTMSLKRNYEGAGLGLAISKAYVELLGGSIRVESEIGKGSTFWIELPIAYQRN